jgi:quercetin dioxygenase-like cupin family protein
MEPLAKNLDNAEKIWTFLDGSKRTAVVLESVAIGRGEYLPGWRWSLHVGKQTGKSSAAHIGYVLSGRMAVRGADGKEITVGPGEAFEVGPGHDAWVVGDEPCAALDFEHLNSHSKPPKSEDKKSAISPEKTPETER